MKKHVYLVLIISFIGIVVISCVKKECNVDIVINDTPLYVSSEKCNGTNSINISIGNNKVTQQVITTEQE